MNPKPSSGKQTFRQRWQKALAGLEFSSAVSAEKNQELLAERARELAEREGLWFHVDGAIGGFLALSNDVDAVRGLERADSLALDLHKWMQAPIDVGLALVRDEGAHRRTFSVVPEYLTGSTDLGNLSFRMPAMHPMIGLEDSGLSLHTAGFATAARSGAGDRAVLDGADPAVLDPAALDPAVLAATRDQVLRRDADDATVSQFHEAAAGVVTLDSSPLTFEQTVEALLTLVAEQVTGQGPPAGAQRG